MSYSNNKGLDFSKIKKIVDFKNLSTGIVYKDNYYNPKTEDYDKSKTRQIVTTDMRSVIVDCIKDRVGDYDVVISRLESAGVDSVKLSYWQFALRAFGYLDINSESDVDGWVESPKDMTFYTKECA